MARLVCFHAEGPREGYETYRPPAFDTDSKTTFAQVSREDVTTSEIQPVPSEWFNICGLGVYSGIQIGFVGLFIDTSGSMDETTVTLASQTFLDDLATAGLEVRQVVDDSEYWITPFITSLV